MSHPLDYVNETAINLIAEGTRLEGKIVFENVTRVHGTLVGEVRAKEGSTLILSESALVEGDIDADILMIDGFVQGNIVAKSQVFISRTGRVVGNIKTHDLKLEFGAFFEGSCSTESKRPVQDG